MRPPAYRVVSCRVESGVSYRVGVLVCVGELVEAVDTRCMSDGLELDHDPPRQAASTLSACQPVLSSVVRCLLSDRPDDSRLSRRDYCTSAPSACLTATALLQHHPDGRRVEGGGRSWSGGEKCKQVQSLLGRPSSRCRTFFLASGGLVVH